MSATYPKIKDLEANLALLKRPELVATEKIHGANFRILLPAGTENDQILFGAKGTLIKPGSFFAQFLDDVRALLPLDTLITTLGRVWYWVVFGEVYGPAIQPELPYLENGVGFRCFDIMRNAELLPYDEFRELAQRLNLPTVPELYRGKPDMEVFQRLIHEPSSVAEHAPREGIVIHDPSLVPLDDGQAPIAKFKNEPFREKEYRIPVEEFSQMADEDEKIRLFVDGFVTENRLKKMADVLREQGTFTNSPRDIPALVAEMLQDVYVEDSAYAGLFKPFMLSRRVSQKVARLFSEIRKRR
jgi:Rnl2 family RNA ligase